MTRMSSLGSLIKNLVHKWYAKKCQAKVTQQKQNYRLGLCNCITYQCITINVMALDRYDEQLQASKTNPDYVIFSIGLEDEIADFEEGYR